MATCSTTPAPKKRCADSVRRRAASPRFDPTSPHAEIERLTRAGFRGARCLHAQRRLPFLGRRRCDRCARAAAWLARSGTARRTGVAAARIAVVALAGRRRHRPQRQIPGAGADHASCIRRVAEPARQRQKLGQALGAIRNVENGPAPLCRRQRARPRIGRGESRSLRVGHQLAAPGRESRYRRPRDAGSAARLDGRATRLAARYWSTIRRGSTGSSRWSHAVGAVRL